MSYSQEQIDALKKYYPCSDYISLEEYFPGFTKRHIKSIARYYGIKNNNPGHRIDLTGQVFGRLEVMEIDHVTANHKVYWKCKCSCGNEKIVQTYLLKKGTTKSCGCLKKERDSKRSFVNHIGEKFGMLTAIERIPNYKGKGRTYYRCICDCGNEKYVVSGNLTGGKTKTCGCISKRSKEYRNTFDIEYDDTFRRYLIYKHIVPNGKVYIGITRQDVEKRWQNGNGYITQKKFWNAIQKYGWENITHEILETGLTEKEACEKEILYIKEYDSINSKFGYNTSEGGKTGRSLVTPVMQYFEEIPVNFFESHRQAAKSLSVTSRTIQNYINGKCMIEGYRFEEMPAIHTYDIDESLYDIRSEEHFQVGRLMREQNRQETIARNKENGRPICQYDMEGHFIRRFESIVEAQQSGRGLGSICAALKGRGNSKSAGGYQWRYDVGDYSDISPLQFSGRPVLQINPEDYTLIAEYCSMGDAERATGINRKQIFKSCKRIHITSGGFIWRYKDDPNAFVPVEKKNGMERFRIPINQYSLGGKYVQSYSSITEAEIMNPKINGIRAAVSENTINKSAGGYMWEVDTGDHNDITPYHANGRFIDQIDIKTGRKIKRFPSIRAAQKETGINNIAAVCSGRRNKAGGFIWRYSENE